MGLHVSVWFVFTVKCWQDVMSQSESDSVLPVVAYWIQNSSWRLVLFNSYKCLPCQLFTVFVYMCVYPAVGRGSSAVRMLDCQFKSTYCYFEELEGM